MKPSRSARRSHASPFIESLENRRMLSADLIGEFSGNLPDALHAGTNNPFSIEVLNVGNSPAKGKVTIDLYARAVGIADGGVFLGGSTRSVDLKPGSQTTVDLRVTEPATLPDGQYTLTGTIDCNNPGVITPNVSFSDSASVSVDRPAADVTSENVIAPAEPIVIDGTAVSQQPASTLVVNRGTIAAKGTIALNFYLSPDQAFDSNAVPAGSTVHARINLKPGKQKLFAEALIPPDSIPSGNYYLLARVEPGAGIVQKTPGDEVGVAPTTVIVQRPAPITAQAEPDTVLPQSTAFLTGIGRPANPPGFSGESSNASTPAGNSGQSSGDDNALCDQGSNSSSSSDCGQSCDDGSSDCGDDDSQSASDDSGDAGDGSQDSSSQSAADSGDQGASNADNSSPTGDSSGDASSDSGSTDSGADNSGSDDSGADDSGADNSGADNSGADNSGANDSGSDDAGDDGSTDSWKGIQAKPLQPSASTPGFRRVYNGSSEHSTFAKGIK